MCDFIFAALERRADATALGPIFERHGFSIGDHLASSAEDVLFRPTTGHCDCGTVLGSAGRGTSPEKAAERLTSELARLEKAGWSRTKIERWRKQREEGGTRKRNARSEITRWLELVAEVLAQPRVGHLGLAVQAFSGAVDPAGLLVGRARRVALKDLSESVLRGFEDGVLYRFVRNAARGA